MARACGAALLALALALAVASPVDADEHDHIYQSGDEVVMWMNTVGPYHNQQETYEYFTLPFCRGDKKDISHHHETIGEALQGIELEFSGLAVSFLQPVMPREYCSIDLEDEDYDMFVYAVENHYFYQMYVDDLPLWGMVGDYGQDESDDPNSEHVPGSNDEYYIFTHKAFDIGYNGDRIVDVNLTDQYRVKLTKGAKIKFTYSVTWHPSSIPFERRFDKYLDPNFFQHHIHWFSIFNSFMMVIFLVGLVSMILMRTLRKDYARYSKDDDLDDLERDLGDEYGWKQVHGDVFRAPPGLMIFSSLIGTGHQLAMVALCVIIIAILGDLYTSRGSVLTASIFVYAATSPIAGYFGGSFYARHGGKEWIKQMVVTASLFPGTVCSLAFLINFIAIWYQVARAIPFGTMVVLACIGLFVILPLTLVGTVLGRNIASNADHPCRINPVPRPIPEKKWYMEPFVIISLGGILPFGSIFIEMYFIFTSFWAYKIYYVYGFMLLVYLILVVVTVCVTIVCTYFLLNAEDYRWHWTSFLAAGSTAVHIYVYAIYYFLTKTKMYGLFQTTFYFGYMLLLCVGMGILCGTVGFAGTQVFVRQIYRNVKID
eukprot:Opistho-1_new@84430